MPNIEIIKQVKDNDTGLQEFVFRVDGKEYKVIPKSGTKGYDKIDDFLRYIYMSKKRNLNPFTYQNKELFDITRINPQKKPEAIQQSLRLAAQLDVLANKLEKSGKIKEAYQIDIISNTLDSPWQSNKATLFFDEISNQNIETEDAKKVLDIAEKHDLL